MLLSTLWSAYTEHARVFNMIMLSLVIAGLTANFVVRRSRINRRTRRIMGWIFLILIDFVYGYSIAIQEHRPFNASVGIGTILLIGTIIAIMWHPEGDDQRPPRDGAVTSRFMYWLDLKVRQFKARRYGGKHERKHP